MHSKLSPALRIFSLLALCFLIVPLLFAATKFHPSAALLATLPMVMLREKAKEEGEGGGGGQESPDPAAAHASAIQALEDSTMPFSQRISGALDSLKGIDPTGQLAAIQTRLTAAEQLNKAKDQEIADLTAKLAQKEKELTAANANVTDLEASNARLEQQNKDLSAKEQDLEKRAESKAKEKVAALGFPSGKLPAQDDKLGEKTAEERIRELEGSKRLTAALHYQKHKALPDWMN